jgi:hypothetical protein
MIQIGKPLFYYRKDAEAHRIPLNTGWRRSVLRGCTEGGKESYNWRPSPLWAELSFCEQLMHPAEPLDYPIPSNGR